MRTHPKLRIHSLPQDADQNFAVSPPGGEEEEQDWLQYMFVHANQDAETTRHMLPRGPPPASARGAWKCPLRLASMWSGRGTLSLYTPNPQRALRYASSAYHTHM